MNHYYFFQHLIFICVYSSYVYSFTFPVSLADMISGLFIPLKSKFIRYKYT